MAAEKVKCNIKDVDNGKIFLYNDVIYVMLNNNRNLGGSYPLVYEIVSIGNNPEDTFFYHDMYPVNISEDVEVYRLSVVFGN